MRGVSGAAGRNASGRRSERTLVGVVHLGPLTGSPRSGRGLRTVREHAVADARAHVAAGFDAVLVENHGDAPFFPRAVPPETVAAMAVVASVVRDAVPADRSVGVNVLRNDAIAALAVASAASLDFVRVNVLAGAVVTDQGIVEGDAANVMRARARWAPGVRVLADVRVKHAAPLAPRDLEDEVRDLVARAGADALVVTGRATGSAPAVETLRRVREAAPRTPILVGSGATAGNVAALLAHASGVIVGTSVKRGGRTDARVDPARARAFARAARAAR
jgi:membrane complex biogenesis BtpA family protein